MSRKDCAELLRSSGLPVVHYAWPDGSEPMFPCVRYVSDGADRMRADNRNWHRTDRWSATLVMDGGFDDAAADALEDALDEAGVDWSRGPAVWVEAERLMQVEYTFSLPH